jgi:hypothetical protein
MSNPKRQSASPGLGDAAETRTEQGPRTILACNQIHEEPKKE